MRKSFASLVLAALALLQAACTKDPYADFKPVHLLEEGERLLRQGDLDNAEKVLRLGLARVEKSGVNLDKHRPVFVTPLVHLAMKRGSLADAEKLLARTGVKPDVRALNDIAVTVQRSGKLEDARARAELLAQAMAASPPVGGEDLGIYTAAWTTVDRLRVARFDREGAREASDTVIALLIEIAQPRAGTFHPLPNGLRAWMVHYIDHLFATDRPEAAHEVGNLVERIDQNAPPPASEGQCMPLFHRWQNLGCLFEIAP